MNLRETAAPHGICVARVRDVHATPVAELEETVKSVIVTLVSIVVWTASAAAQDTLAGAKVYADQKCGVCHSIAGKGNAKGPLDGIGSKFTADEIREWIVDPAGMTAKHKAARKPPMTAKYGSLPKSDLDALVAYLSSLKK